MNTLHQNHGQIHREQCGAQSRSKETRKAAEYQIRAEGSGGNFSPNKKMIQLYV